MPDSTSADAPNCLQMVPGFSEMLAPFDLEALARRPDTAYGLDSDLRLAMFNPAWFEFARANDGMPAIAREWELGRCLLDACPPVIRDFYAQSLAAALRQGDRWDHEYECSSSSVIRHLLMSVYPLRERRGLLVVNALIIESARDVQETAGPAFDPTVYADGHGIVHQCAHCRKVRRVTGSRHWDWVPELVANPNARISHDLCDICFEFYHPEPGDSPSAV